VVAAACSAAAAVGVETEVETWPSDKVVTEVINDVAGADAEASLTVPVAEDGICPGPMTETAGGAETLEVAEADV